MNSAPPTTTTTTATTSGDAAAYDYLFKFLIIGRAGVGKSCILNRFIENKFKENMTHTIGVEFGSKMITVNNKIIKLQIWDTAGQERFRSVTRSYYRGAAGALLCYDLTSRDSFNSLKNWLTDARNLASPNIFVVLVGNKKDLESSREVSFQEATDFAKENDLMFIETSALNGEGVDEAFVQCAHSILTCIESGQINPDRVGSGIQYGDLFLRNLQLSNSEKQKATQSSCPYGGTCSI